MVKVQTCPNSSKKEATWDDVSKKDWNGSLLSSILFLASCMAMIQTSSMDPRVQIHHVSLDNRCRRFWSRCVKCPLWFRRRQNHLRECLHEAECRPVLIHLVSFVVLSPQYSVTEITHLGESPVSGANATANYANTYNVLVTVYVVGTC